MLKVIIITKETSLADRERHVLSTWGKKAIVVSVAAM